MWIIIVSVLVNIWLIEKLNHGWNAPKRAIVFESLTITMMNIMLHHLLYINLDYIEVYLCNIYKCVPYKFSIIHVIICVENICIYLNLTKGGNNFLPLIEQDTVGGIIIAITMLMMATCVYNALYYLLWVIIYFIEIYIFNRDDFYANIITYVIMCAENIFICLMIRKSKQYDGNRSTTSSDEEQSINIEEHRDIYSIVSPDTNQSTLSINNEDLPPTYSDIQINIIDNLATRNETIPK